MLPNVSGLRLDGPPSVGTGEFSPLGQPEIDALNAGGGMEAFTVEKFQQDTEPVEGWHAFRVRAEFPRPDGTYAYQYYRAESLWKWVQDGNQVDPITRGPIWFEDYVELHNRFAPDAPVPPSATLLRRKNAPAPPSATLLRRKNAPAPNRMPARLGPRTRSQRNRGGSLFRAAAVPARSSDFDKPF